MTPKIIELKQSPVVLVELSDTPIKVEDSFANGFIYTEKDGYLETFYLDDICLDSKCLGLLSNLTEEQFTELVQNKSWGGKGGFYRDYQNLNGTMFKAEDSFWTLLGSEGYNAGNHFDPSRTVVLVRKEAQK